MKQTNLLLMALLGASINMMAQPPADTTPKVPQGATYALSDGSTTTGTGTQQTTPVENICVTQSAPQGVYTMDGRYLGNTTDALPHGAYIVSGGVVIR